MGKYLASFQGQWNCLVPWDCKMIGLEQSYLLLFNELGFSPYCANKTKYNYVLSVDADKRLQQS